MNKIIYKDYEFTDPTILNAELVLSNAMISESLPADLLKFTALAGHKDKLRTILYEWYHTVQNQGFVIQEGLIESWEYAEPVYYYRDDELQGKFFITNIKRVGAGAYEFEATSAIGLLINIVHKGGVFEQIGTTVGDLVREIFDKIGFIEGVDYSIDSQVDDEYIYGRLPYSNCRDNLRQILFAVGASIVKEDNGILNIKYLASPETKVVQDSQVYMNGTVDLNDLVSRVEVVEHKYRAYLDDELVTLYDNTDRDNADHELVIFDEAYHPYLGTGEWVLTGSLTINEIGANYAIVSGLGTLSGYKYNHTTRVVSEIVDPIATENVVRVEDATLISHANSVNAAKRLAQFYMQKRDVKAGIVLDGTLKPSNKIVFTDPFGDEAVGYIKEMNIELSHTNKSETVISTGWTPAYFGNNYSSAIKLTESGTWIATKTTTARFVLIGGGKGGTGGQKGGNGSVGEKITNYSIVRAKPFPENAYSEAGEGGQYGEGGQGGKILIINVPVTQGDEITFTLGEGGEGGAINGGIGTDGTATTITVNGQTYTSEDGISLDNGYTDLMTGEVFGQKGWRGVNGRNGARHIDDANIQSTDYIQVAPNVFKPVTLKDGEKTLPYGYVAYQGGMIQYEGNVYATEGSFEVFETGGGGGAFCFEYNNLRGGTARSQANFNVYIYDPQNPGFFITCGNGGNGQNAISLEEFCESEYNTWGVEYEVAYGQGGCGGNGGGGGSANSNAYFYDGPMPPYFFNEGTASVGGNGSKGCTGGQGIILVYV